MDIATLLDRHRARGAATLVIEVPDRPGRPGGRSFLDLNPSIDLRIGTEVSGAEVLRLTWEPAHGGASRHHATLSRARLEWRLTDRSTNGTRVVSRDGLERDIVDDTIDLHHGDAIQIGTTTIWFAFGDQLLSKPEFTPPLRSSPDDIEKLAMLSNDQLRILEAVVRAAALHQRAPSVDEIDAQYRLDGGAHIERFANALTKVHLIVQGKTTGPKISETLRIWRGIRSRQAGIVKQRLNRAI